MITRSRLPSPPCPSNRNVITSAPTATNSLAADDKNAISNALISPSQFQRIESDPSISDRLANGPSGYFRYIALNMNSPELSDVRVRQAINFALNKSELQSVYGGPKFGG